MKTSIISLLAFILSGASSVSMLNESPKISLAIAFIAIANLAFFVVERIDKSKYDKSN